MSNRIELEKSYIISKEDEEKIEEKLKLAEFKLVSEENECDTYFSDKNLKFIKDKVCLRTRKINNECLELTYKPKSTEETEKYGKREVNIQLKLEDENDIKFIIEQLGYKEYVSFKKYRKTFSKKVNGFDRNVMIDELDGIGKFIELEILSDIKDKQTMEKELKDFIGEFGFDKLQIKKLPYRDIAKNGTI